MSVKAKSGTGNEANNGAEGNTEAANQSQGKAAGQSTEGKTNEGANQNQEELDESGWDEKTKAYIEKLRRENGSHRTKAKDLTTKLTATESQFQAVKKALGIDDASQETPEQKIQKLEGQSGQLEFRNAVLEQALNHGIGSEGINYFTFLLNQAAENLGEGEEITEDMMTGIVQEVKAKGTKTAGNTSVSGAGSGSKTAPAPGGTEALTVEQFAKMSLAEKSALYVKDKAQYNAMMQEARRSNRLFK